MSELVPLHRRPRTEAGRRAPSGRIVRLVGLRVPLAAKLIGANLTVVAVLAAAWLFLGDTGTAAVAAVIIGVAVLHLALVLVALRPIRDLEDAAGRVWRGDYGARVERSAVADREVLRIGTMFNTLLDSLVADRARMRALAAEVIEVGDRERAALARELHDSTAQRLAGLLLQLSAMARDCTDPELSIKLDGAREAAKEITEEVRLLSHTLHPRVLDDLGVAAALQKLGRDASTGTGIIVDVDASHAAASTDLPPGIGSVLYRVAQEAVRNAIRHANPRHVRVVLRLDPDLATLEVHDDGQGFDLAAAERRRAGMGLLSMQERVSLVEGELEIRTAPKSGTTVVATVPLKSMSIRSQG